MSQNNIHLLVRHREINISNQTQCYTARDVKKRVLFAFEIFHEIFQFFNKFFFKYFKLPDTALLCKKIKLCATINTANGSMTGKATMIILCVIYASLESEKTFCTSNFILNVG